MCVHLCFRGSKLLFVDGYKYSRKRVNKFGSVSWRCRVLGCHATITTTEQGEVLRLGRSGHTHLPNERSPSGYTPENKRKRPEENNGIKSWAEESTSITGERNDENTDNKWIKENVNMADEPEKAGVAMETVSRKEDVHEEIEEKSPTDEYDEECNYEQAEGNVVLSIKESMTYILLSHLF